MRRGFPRTALHAVVAGVLCVFGAGCRAFEISIVTEDDILRIEKELGGRTTVVDERSYVYVSGFSPGPIPHTSIAVRIDLMFSGVLEMQQNAWEEIEGAVEVFTHHGCVERGYVARGVGHLVHDGSGFNLEGDLAVVMGGCGATDDEKRQVTVRLRDVYVRKDPDALCGLNYQFFARFPKLESWPRRAGLCGEQRTPPGD